MHTQYNQIRLPILCNIEDLLGHLTALDDVVWLAPESCLGWQQARQTRLGCFHQILRNDKVACFWIFQYMQQRQCGLILLRQRNRVRSSGCGFGTEACSIKNTGKITLSVRLCEDLRPDRQDRAKRFPKDLFRCGPKRSLPIPERPCVPITNRSISCF